MLLTCTSVHTTVHQIVTNWACSGYGRQAHGEMLRDIHGVQENEQFGLHLAALLYYQRLFPLARTDTAFMSDNSSLLVGFSNLLNGEPLESPRKILESVILSLLHLLKYRPSKETVDLHRFLTSIDINTDTLMQHPDQPLSQYLKSRLEGQDHRAAFKEAWGTVIEMATKYNQLSNCMAKLALA